MSWKNIVKEAPAPRSARPEVKMAKVVWSEIVSIDFETYFDTEYTLRKLSTSEYIRDPRFKVQMMGIRVGKGSTRIVCGADIKRALEQINWKEHALLCHNTQFDGFILSHHYGVYPAFYYDSLSMARGLHSNEIGAGLDEVSLHYGGGGKIENTLEKTSGVLNWGKELSAEAGVYCANDVDEMIRVFGLMLPKMPQDEVDLINLTCRMFCMPRLLVDIPRVAVELERELKERERHMYAAVDPDDWDAAQLLNRKERELSGIERDMLLIKRVIGSSEKFADLLRAEGIDPPMKIAPAWMNRSKEDKLDEEGKYTYAFAKDDIAFISLPHQINEWGFDLDDPDQMAQAMLRQERLQALVDARISVKSTTNITRAERFLIAGANGAGLPIGYAYYRAHTGRWGGQNKMNMQNLKRGGELRQSILAPKGHMIAVQDSGQIEARVNGWLWGQQDLLDGFRDADTGMGKDAYCNFADLIYERNITKADKTERFVGKVCVLGLGFQMGAAKLQTTLGKGALGGPPVHFTLDYCKQIINTYRRKNHHIAGGWVKCQSIIEDMAKGHRGAFGPLHWEANTIWLPNGMALKYPDLKSAEGDKGWQEWSYQSGNMRKKIYGGLLCENIVQALARIIVAWQMLLVDKKYPVVMTTHDEIVALPTTAQAEACIKYMAKCMSTAPAWCSDIPLNCEGGYACNYSK